MGATQSEESGLMWETSSSRCSTSQASETSATSGVYSMENSFMDCPSGKSMFSMDEEKIALRRNSPDHTPQSPDEKISPGSTKAQEKEFDPADPQSWPFQVQPSKIKDYLVLITQDMGTSLSEEKENPLMKKGELPLKGTVRARIQLITAVLEERHKKIFRRVNNKDVPPPSDVIKKPREQPKIFSRQGISVSLRHIERDATDKNNRKEIPRYNLKHVGTGISKSGVSVPSYKDEKRTRRSFLPEILNKASEKPPPISSILANKAKKPNIKSYSPGNQTPIPEQASLVQPDLPDKTEVRKAQSLPLSSAKIMPENSTNLHAERGKQKMQNYSPVTTENTDGSEKSKALPEREPAESCSAFSYPASEAEMQPDSTAMVPSEPTAQEVQYSNNTAATLQETEKSVLAQARNQDVEFSAPSQLDTKDTAVFHFAEEAGNQDIPLYSPERKQAELPSVSETEEQEKEQPGMGYSKVAAVQEQLTVSLQAESDHLPLLPSIKEMKAGEIEALPDLSAAVRRTETQELQSDSYKSVKLPLPPYVTGEAEHEEKEYQESEFIKQGIQAQSAVTTPLEPNHSDVSQSRGKGENQTALPESQCPDSSLPVAYVDREEIQSDSPAIAQSESEHPAIFEPVKVPQGSEPTEPLHLRDKEEKQYSPTEELNLSEQLPSISSLLSENTEKQGTPLPSVVTAASLSKHPAWPTEQTETHEGLSPPPETATVAAETPFTTGTFQNVNVTDVEMQPLSPTEVPREELLPISREPDVLKDRKTTQLVSSLSAEPLNAASVSPKEEEKLENQFGAPINAKLCSEEQDVSRPIIDESQQEGQINSFESGSFGLDYSTESQPKKQSMGQNFSVSSQLEETTALYSVDEGDKKDERSDKPFFELLDADLLQSASALDKQKPQSNIEQTTQQLLHTILPIESDVLPSVEETQIHGSSSHFPGKKQNLGHTIKLIETEENQSVLRGNAALDSRYSTIPSPKAEEETHIPTEPEARSMEKQSIEVETSGLEADFQDVSYSVCESDKHLDASVPLPSTEGETFSHSLNSADSNTMDSKTMVINEVVLAKTEEETYLPSVDRDLKEPEKYLQKEKGLEDEEKQRELIPAPELDQEKDTFTISEGYQVGKIQAPPLISPVDKDKHMLESLEYLEAVPLLKTKPFHDTEDVVLQQEPSVGKILEGLKADIHENKGNESKELTKAKGVQESAETTIEVSAIPENKCYGILKATDIDYFEKYTLTDETSFTQTGKEQSIKDVQRSFDITNEHSEEGTSPVSSSESILKFSSLEKDLDKAKKENATITHEATSKILNEAAATKGNSENTAGELNLLAADAPLFNTGKDVLCQSPLTPLPTTVVSPGFLEAPPALSFLYEDLYEGVVEELKEDSSKYPSNEKTEYTENDVHIRGHASDDGSGIYCKKDIPDDSVPNTSEESQTEKVLKDQPIIGQALNEPRVTESAWEPSEKKHEPPHIPAEAPAPGGVISPTGVMESQSNTLIESPAEIISDVKVEICRPTYAIPFGSGFYSSGLNRETTDQQEPKELSDQPFVELDYSLLSHEFDTYPLYSIKEEEYSDIDEDLAELMDYEMVARDDVFQEEISSEAAHEELLLDDRKSLDHISDTYEFVNEREASMYPEEEEFELMNSEKLPRNIPETEILQEEIDWAQLDSYCYQCQCPISGEDKLFGEHKEHDVTDLDRAATVLKSQLDGSLDVLQERSLKIEGFVGEIEALFNSLEENCKEKEQLLEEQNESIIKMVVENHDRKAQSFEEVKNTKMEYLYEQMVNFQDYIDTAKDTLETIIRETEGMDDFVFLQSSEEINKRLLSAVEEIITVEKMPAAFSQFEHYAGGSANADQTLTHMPVPQTPKLQPQDPNSATSTSIAVYWTVNEDDVIDFFQVYCMEKCPGNKEQGGLVEEYRVTVKESNCILEDLEPGHCYSVWVMAVNYTGCSFPSEKSTFRTAPPTPVINAEECTICWDTATIRWTTSHPEATDSFTLEYCRQYSPEGEGLRSLAGIKRPEMKVRLESNINYFFYVRAVNSFGTSEQSEAALISTKGTRFHLMKETTHPALHISPNGTMISLPKDSKLTGISPVLGELLPARGWHYWETTVSGCAAYRVGICSSSIRQDSVLGQNGASWCLHCPILHNGEMSDVIVTEEPARIGILLDYNTGRLLFFNAERGQMLTSIRHKFTEAVHPAFVLEQPGVLNLHTGMELPEFVEQS
uniref:Cardiomyopathy-associated protein 5 n=1 Tax=Varanus komodoensis TaxID=61221 RepID=A0A8D2KWN4_VARKO